jgi:two-component system response regulator DegU
MTLMIVDDNKKMREMIKKIICHKFKVNISIIECSNGQEAIEFYDEYRPDWVLMDIEMKPLNGLSTTAEIIAAHPEAKVVIVTQYNETEFREAANTAGACAYVLKDNLLEITNIIKEN